MFASRDRDKVRRLFNVNTIVVINKTCIGKRRLVFTREHEVFASDRVDCFGSILVTARKSKVIGLTEEKNFKTVEHSGVDSTVMGSTFKVERGQKWMELMLLSYSLPDSRCP